MLDAALMEAAGMQTSLSTEQAHLASISACCQAAALVQGCAQRLRIIVLLCQRRGACAACAASCMSCWMG